VTKSDIADLLETYRAVVTATYPMLGQIEIRADLSAYADEIERSGDPLIDHIRTLLAASRDFESDERIVAAAPDLAMYDQQVDNTLSPSSVMNASQLSTGERKDWGMVDTQSDQVWSEPGTEDGAMFGVMDSGFAKHQDLVFSNFPPNTPAGDHGNHVAGIACATHDGKLGVMGVIPHCFLRVFTTRPINVPIEGSSAKLNKVLALTDTLASVEDFAEQQTELASLNISLGYNWTKWVGVNPEDEDSADFRAVVVSQGKMALSLLNWAHAHDVVVFSAAGNDSEGMEPRISTLYASPFNWAAITARQFGINSGVIVEAHDQDGNMASFSNKDGDLSCPGVNILSTVAKDASDTVSNSSYGLMSGTSMASPYCAAALTLLKLVRPGYSGEELVKCMIESGAPFEGQAPHVRLKAALSTCPAR
jgi:subtilisin family serine protease